ncbi:MAG TPA: hypothetical protein VF601_05380 [Beijerinckiaceae bacterium]|jgi:hypothetical protein
MAKRHDISDWSDPDEPRRGSLGMKLVLFGALLPVFLAAVLVGGFLLARGTGERAATVTAGEAPLDCSSARDAWRSACRTAASVGDGPSTTGGIEPRATGRSSTVKTAAAEPVNQVKEPAKPVAAAPAKVPPPPARPAAREPDRTQDAAALAEAPKPAATPAPERSAAVPSEEAVPAMRPRLAATPKAEPKPAAMPMPERAAPPEEPVPAKPRLAAVPEPAAPKPPVVAPPEPALPVDEKTFATPSAKPGESARSERAAIPERAAPERRRDVERTAALPASRAVVRERERAVAERDEEPAPRLARHRAKAEAARAVAAARSRVVKQRVRTARARMREAAPDLDGGYRVTSQRIYMLPGGQQVVVHTRPRAEDVRDLLAEHRARFGARRVASPYWGAPSYGGWHSASEW